MNKLLSIFIILVIFTSSASASQISGKVISDGKNLADLKVILNKVNTTQSAEGSVVFNFIPLSGTITDKDGNYAFNDINNGEYRVNITYGSTTYGENIDLQGKAAVDFNLSGVIEGYVFRANKTLEGIPVHLVDATGIEVMNTNTDKSGKYSFNKVNNGRDTGRGYFVETTYADAPYTKQANVSEIANFTVYESTAEKDIIRVTIDHIVFSKASNGIKVDEYVEFMNTGDKVFFSKNRTWLGVSTPEGITRFQTDAMECCLQREKDAAWVDPMNPIMPNETYRLQLSYVFNPESSNNIFNKGSIYNTSYLAMLSDKNNGFGIESKSAKKEIVPNEGKEFEVLSFADIPRDQRIDTQIIGFVPSKMDSDAESNYFVPILAVAAIGAVSYPFLKNRKNKKAKRRFIKPISSAQISTDGLHKGLNKAVEPEVNPEIDPEVGSEVDPAVDDSIVESNLRPDVVENIPERDITEMSFDELLAEKNAAFGSVLNLENKFNTGEIQEKEYKELKKEYKERAILVIKQLKEAALDLDLEQPVPVLEKVIACIDDIDVLEELIAREKEGENRNELKEIIEQRIEYIEQNE